MNNKRKQSSVISPEEAMSSYFGDFFGEGCATVSDGIDLPSSPLEFIPSASVEPGYCLILVSKLSTRIVDFSRPRRALVESFVLLLWGLYFLRQPIDGKLRVYVQDYCNDMSMEYHLLLGLANTKQAEGESE